MYSLNSDKMFYDIADNQAIIIDSSTGDYYALNILGSLTFDFLAKGASEASIIAALKQLPLENDNIEEKFNAFVEKLLKADILTKCDASSGIQVIFDVEAVAGEYTFDMEQFDDSRDILLADPIHDVDEEQGWPVLKNDKK